MQPWFVDLRIYTKLETFWYFTKIIQNWRSSNIWRIRSGSINKAASTKCTVSTRWHWHALEAGDLDQLFGTRGHAFAATFSTYRPGSSRWASDVPSCPNKRSLCQACGTVVQIESKQTLHNSVIEIACSKLHIWKRKLWEGCCRLALGMGGSSPAAAACALSDAVSAGGCCSSSSGFKQRWRRQQPVRLD